MTGSSSNDSVWLFESSDGGVLEMLGSGTGRPSPEEVLASPRLALTPPGSCLHC